MALIRSLKFFFVLLLLSVLSPLLTACEDEPDNPVEAAGEAIEETGEDIQDAADE